MSRLAQVAIQKKAYDEEQKKLKDAADKEASVSNGGDGRPVANKVFDALNLWDSGRSYTNDKVSKEEADKGAGEQTMDTVKGLFSGANKTVQAVNALTGYSEKKSNERDAKRNKDISDINDQIDKDPTNKTLLDKKKKILDDYQNDLQKTIKDTAWAGTKDKGIGDRLKKAAGTSAETVSEFLPVGKGVQAGKLAEQGAVKGAEKLAEKGATKAAADVAETGVSRMAKAKLAAKVGGQQAAVGAAGGAGGAASEDGSSLEDVARSAITGGVMGGVTGAAGTALPSLGRRAPEEAPAAITPAHAAETAITPANPVEAAAQHLGGQPMAAEATPSISAPAPGTPTERVQQALAAVDKPQGASIEAPIVVNRIGGGKPDARANITAPDAVEPPNISNISTTVPKKTSQNDTDSLLNEFSKLRKQYANDDDFFDKVVLENQDTPGVIGQLARSIARTDATQGGKSYTMTQILDDELTPINEAAQKAEFKSSNLQDLKQTARQLEKDTGQKGLYKNLTENMKDMNEDEQIAYLSKGLTDARDSGAMAAAYMNKQNGFTPPRSKEDAAEELKQLSISQDSKVQLKVLDDLQHEADARTPGGIEVPASQVTETRTQRGAQYIVDDIDNLQKKTGIDVTPIDRDVAAKLTGEVQRSNFQEFRDKMGRNFQDTLTYGARTLGKTGSDFVYDMLQGNKFKRDALDALRENMGTIGKLNKELAGKSLAGKRDLGARIGQALDDRANVDQYIKNPKERELFDQYVQVFDYVKTLREKSGLEVLENYRPWVDMKNAAEPPMWLAENVTNKRTQTLSRFSKERTKTEAGDNVDNNLADMIYGYVNSQLNEMAYDAPVKKLKVGIDGLNGGNKANVGAMNEGIDYMRELVQQAVNPARKNPLERAAGKLTSNVYGAVLPFNVRLAIQNKTQKFVANSRVSKGARNLARKLSAEDAKELEGGLVFGDTTVYGQLEDVNPSTAAKKTLGQKAAKIDPYQKSEHNNVITSYHKGAMQAVLDSDQYKTLRQSGMKPVDAVHEALKDPQVKENAIRRGNVVVNDTQFGASPLARPEMLREEGSIWGVLPKKTVYMFTRFPIGMSQHTLEVLDNKSARALEMLKNGDPRSVSVAEMRTNYKALLDSMKDAKVAIKGGTDIGIPEDVLNKQIDAVSKNMKVIDAEAKKLSSIRGGKTIKNLGKMWAAAAAIQIIFDGGIQSFADDPGGTTADALSKTNPTASNKIVGSYSPLASVTSSASPLDRRGNINERAIANYIPGVGLAVNRGRDIKKLVESLTGAPEEEK